MEAYERLLKGLGIPEKKHAQVNYYFDTADRDIIKRKGMLRVRAQGEIYFMTLKYGLTVENGYFRAANFEEEIPESVYNELIVKRNTDVFLQYSNSVTGALWNFIPRKPLQCIGSIENERSVYVRDGFQLECDHTRYHTGHEDFEIEIETDDTEQARQLIDRLNTNYILNLQPQIYTKFERFLRQI